MENSGEENQLLTADELHKDHLKGDGAVQNIKKNPHESASEMQRKSFWLALVHMRQQGFLSQTL